ncbi:MAG: hypothetical protein P1U56_24480 [Saprospiraceae bacterium]|nr:hypothetical protein [Saprospiraceae bacterium]
MIIKKYSVELHRLTEEDIELIRQHRNSDIIRSKMFFQDEISQEDQKRWFETINNDSNYYFTIEWKGEKVGLIHGEVLSLTDRVTTGGVFFWNQDVLSTYIPVCASVIMADLTFLLLDMHTSTAIVRSDNKVAIKFNESLGYTISKVQDHKIHMTLKKEDYLSSKVRQLVKRITKDGHDLGWDNIQLSVDELENKNSLIIPYLLTQYKLQSKKWVN